MNASMTANARAYRNTLLTLWVTLSAIAYFYSKQQDIPAHIALWFSAAALVEVAFYIAPGFAWSRTLVDSIEPAPVRAFILMITALVPYGIYAIGTGTFHWRSFGLLAAIATAVSAWYVVQSSKRAVVDFLFVAILAAILLSKVFGSIYITLAPKAEAAVLGQLMLIRTGAFAVLSIRKMGGIGYGFVPSARDWTVGILSYLALMPVIWAANQYLHIAAPRLAPGPWWRVVLLAVGTFLAFLWVVALSEEFVFRGILQQVISQRAGSIAGLILTSALFGLAHLPFRSFPNWRWVAIATILGLVCGIAYKRAGSIRAAAVTHALVVTTWRVFFA
jgi:membrane protease YdiL (CAAX protease family)